MGIAMKQPVRMSWRQVLGAVVMAGIIIPVPVSAMTVFALDLPRSPLPTVPAATTTATAGAELLSQPGTPAKARAATSEPKPVVASLLGVSAIATPPPRSREVSAMAENPVSLVTTSHPLPSLISVPLANVRSGSSTDPPTSGSTGGNPAFITTGPSPLLGPFMSRTNAATNFSSISTSSTSSSSNISTSVTAPSSTLRFSPAAMGGCCFSTGMCCCRCGGGITIIINITINDPGDPTPTTVNVSVVVR